MVLGSSVGMMEIKPIDKPETQQINQETKSKILILNTLAKDSILSNNPALLSKIEEFLYTEEHKLRDMYSQEKIKLTLPADASDETRKQLIILYNLKEKWTPEAKDLIKNITVITEDGKIRLIAKTSRGLFELKVGKKKLGELTLGGYNIAPQLYLIDINYEIIENKYFDNYLYNQIILVCNLSNLSFKVNARFNIFEQIKKPITNSNS